MKQLATIGVVVALLLGAAIYFASQRQPADVDPVTPDPTPIVDNTPTPTGQPTTTAEAKGTLTLRTSISNGYVLSGTGREMYAAIDIEALKHEGGDRPPLNVSVVIDRSGSMSGDKIEHAKAAARRLVNVLGPKDRISIVSYGSDVTVDFPSQPVTESGRMELFRAINDISVGGGTNLSGGFQRGYSEVGKWKNPEAVSRLILMSDGHANVGITNTQQLVRLSTTALQSRVSVSTIGVGLDYNEDLMTQMANQGAGNYYFVDRADTIVSIFESELKGLAGTVARNTSVVLKLGKGVRLVDLYGFPHQKSGDQVFVSLAEFASEEKKNILMKLAVDATTPGTTAVLSTSMSYDDLVLDKPSNQTLALTTNVTQKPAEAEKLVNADVVARVQQVEVAKSMQDAMDFYAEGKAGEAEKLLNDTQVQMRQARQKYKLGGAARFDAADKEMDQMKQEINAAPAASEEGRRLRKAKKARSNAIMFEKGAF